MTIKQIIAGKKAPIGFFRKKQNRKDLIVYFMETVLQKIPTDIPSINDFKNNNLYSFLIKYYGGSPVKALMEGYEDLNLKQLIDDPNFIVERVFFEKKSPPKKFWNNLENRQLTIFKLITQLNKPVTEIKVSDFKEYNLLGFLVHYYEGSPKKALSIISI